jgi:hypothetical protein
MALFFYKLRELGDSLVAKSLTYVLAHPGLILIDVDAHHWWCFHPWCREHKYFIFPYKLH